MLSPGNGFGCKHQLSEDCAYAHTPEEMDVGMMNVQSSFPDEGQHLCQPYLFGTGKRRGKATKETAFALEETSWPTLGGGDSTATSLKMPTPGDSSQ
ncbi:unnamed protein product [Amoebophrya sp. A25]|nr:unnamed protein product [Amoebophrya sp. A25]|eukprot:GSA25T00002856001.1